MRRAVPYVAAIVAVTITTLVIALVWERAPIANISMLYLVAVLVVAVASGRAAAIVASVLAFLTFDWFFVPPFHQLVVADPQELFSVALFLLTAVITGTLAARQRARAEDARQREREATLLYEAAFVMAGEPSLDRATAAVAEHFRTALDLDAVAIEVEPESLARDAVAARDAAARAALHEASAELRVLEPRAPSRRVRVIGPRGTRVRDRRVHVLPIIASGQRVGRIQALPRLDKPELAPRDERLLAIAAAQLGLTIERARLRSQAVDAEVLRRADELKTQLLQAVSHELRTPLASILASAGSLRQTDVTWTHREREEFAASIQEEALRLDRVVGNLLDLSRIENGTLVPHKAWHDVGSLVEDVAGRLRPVTAGHTLRVEVPEDLPPVELDYVEIQQVLANLVENAAKFSPDGTEIGIRVAKQDGSVRFEVSDAGPGIPAADAERIFAPFVRLQRGGFSARGVGLGLAVAKKLIEAHAGSIWVDPTASRGARVVFTLPLQTRGA